VEVEIVMQVELGGKVYTTKASVERYAKALKQQAAAVYSQGTEGYAFLLDLIKTGHLGATQKIGVGVAHFFVEEDYKGITRFTITRIDGTTIDFSYLKCIRYLNCKPDEARKADAWHNLQGAARYAISSQIERFRCQVQLKNCVLCGALDAEHVDHFEPQFIDLLKAFNTGRSDIPQVFNDAPSSERGMRKPKQCFRQQDETYCKAFEAYHAQYAKLRLLCAKCNLGRKRAT